MQISKSKPKKISILCTFKCVKQRGGEANLQKNAHPMRSYAQQFPVIQLWRDRQREQTCRKDLRLLKP